MLTDDIQTQNLEPRHAIEHIVGVGGVFWKSLQRIFQGINNIRVFSLHPKRERQSGFHLWIH